MNTQIIKPLGKITAILADLGLEVTYAYDDLVFVQECVFLLQFTEDLTSLNIFYNIECEPTEANHVVEAIIAATKTQGFSLTPKGTYTLIENDDQTVDIKFT
jgi:hypothetical protein